MQVGVIAGTQKLARQCCKDSLKLKKKISKDPISDAHKMHYADLDPSRDPRMKYQLLWKS